MEHDAVIQQHELWLKTLGKEGITLRLENMIFEKIDFRGRVLSEAVIVGSTFVECKLDGVDFYSANLSGCTFENTTITKAILTKANLTQAHFKNANLAQSSLIRTEFTHSNFSSVNLEDANLMGAFFLECMIQDTNFATANFQKCSFNTCTFRGCNFITARQLDSVVINNVTVKGANDLFIPDQKLFLDWIYARQ